MESKAAIDFARVLQRYESELAAVRYEDLAELGIVHVELSANDSDIRGTGSAETLELATQKAISEFVERAAYRHFKQDLGLNNTNGMAAHPIPSAAISGAKAELIERDAFISSWLLTRGPAWIPPDTIPSPWSEKAKKLSSLGIEARIGLQANTNGMKTGVGLLLPRMGAHFGYAVTCAAAEDTTSLFDRIWADFGRYSGIILYRTRAGIPISRVSSATEILKPGDHLEYTLNPIRRVPEWFLAQKNAVDILSSFSIRTTELYSGQFMDCPVTVILAQSADAQPYYVGATKHEKVNFPRLRNISNQTAAITLNLEPHPLP